MEITVNKGRITSPNYPSNYPNNLMCGWIIKTQVEGIPVRVRQTHLFLYKIVSFRLSGQGKVIYVYEGFISVFSKTF